MDKDNRDLKWAEKFAKRKGISKELLNDYYWNSEMSLNQIARKLGVAKRSVRLMLMAYGIPRRERLEGVKVFLFKQAVEKGYNEVIYNEEEKKLLALAIDLEGSIYMSKSKTGNNVDCSVSIANTDIRLINFIRSLAKTGSVCKCKSRSPKHKGYWIWSISNLFILERFLTQIVPYLIAKKKQGELVLEFCKNRLDRFRRSYSMHEFIIYEKVKALNKRGPA